MMDPAPSTPPPVALLGPEVPSTPRARRQLTRDQRLHARVLRGQGRTYNQIAIELRYTER